jgi:hypothetical protein
MSRLRDLTGLKFGSWEVLRRGPNGRSGKGVQTRWLCKCVCGTEKLVWRSSLIARQSTSCGCSRVTDLTGKRYGYLLVLRRGPDTPAGIFRWVCLCENCGKETLTTGCGEITARSCGCSRIETVTTHGLCGSVAYFLWQAAQQRAKKRGHVFTITPADIVVPTHCPLLGVVLKRRDGNKKGTASPNAPSIDRIDPSVGYEKSNIQVISHRANSIKNNATFEEFERMYENWKRLKQIKSPI